MAYLSRKELEDLIASVKASGGDASRLEALLADYLQNQQREQKPSMKPANIKDYYTIWHSLRDGDPQLAEQLLNSLPPDMRQREGSRDISKHALVIRMLGNYCPWIKAAGCPCEAVLQGGECKAKLFRGVRQ
jgi:hypothetical protein